MRFKERFSRQEYHSCYANEKYRGAPGFCVQAVCEQFFGYNKYSRENYEPLAIDIEVMNEIEWLKCSDEEREEFTRSQLYACGYGCERTFIAFPSRSNAPRALYKLLGETYEFIQSLGIVATCNGTPLYVKVTAVPDTET